MPVFISHSSADDLLARSVARTLTATGIDVYVDDYDPDALAAASITDYLLGKIDNCSHLMVIVSRKTQSSWWVPFEIGVARKGTKRITSMLTEDIYANLPAFLKVWPVMTSTAQLQHFISAYLSDSSITLVEKGVVHLAEAQRTKTAYDFHAVLKRALGQS